MSVINFPTNHKALIAIYQDLSELQFALGQFESMLTNHPSGHHFDSVYGVLVKRHYDLCQRLQDSLPLQHLDKNF